MDEKRAKTLEALSEFIESQRALLSRTQSDIERLKELRDDISRTSEVTPSTLRQQLEQRVFRLNDQGDLAVNITKEIDWSLYKFQDPSAFQSLASDLRHTHSLHDQPSHFQRSELSDLQKFVKQHRQSIVNPILTRLASDPQYISSSGEDEPLDSEEIRRELERKKIRRLKKRKNNCALTILIHDGIRRVSGSSNIFIRRDQDESADVDVILDDAPEEGAIELDPPLCSAMSPVSSPPTLQTLSHSSSREQCSSWKVERHGTVAPAIPRTEAKHNPLKKQGGTSKPTRVRGPKSDTYKLAWSVEEQHLLERLLEEIPDGERNRWAKISQAMNGRRTARQVASRVQKYFEKLKKFGVE